MQLVEQLSQYYFFRILFPSTTKWVGPARVMREDQEIASRTAERLHRYVYLNPGSETRR